jgi:hypothetical protein
MQRLTVSLTVVVVLLVAVLGTMGRSTTAQEDTMAEHPFVGSWLVVDPTITDPAENVPSLGVVAADGTYLESHPDVGVGVGAWVPTGEHTADLTIVFRATDEAGKFEGLVTGKGTIEVNEAGTAWDGTYSVEAVGPDGTVLFSVQGQSHGTRIEVGPMMPLGTPMAGTPTP